MVDPRLAEIIREGAKAEVAKVHVSNAAEVLEYNADDETARIVLEVMRREVDENGENIWDEVVIPEVTVAWPRFGGFELVGPLKEGDQVTAVYFDRSHDDWQSGQGPGIEPVDYRRHDYADAWCLPGGIPPAEADGTPSDELVLGETSDTGMKIRIANGTVSIGTSATELLDELTNALNELESGLLDTATSVTATILGPQPLSNAGVIATRIAKITAIRQLIEQIRNS